MSTAPAQQVKVPHDDSPKASRSNSSTDIESNNSEKGHVGANPAALGIGPSEAVPDQSTGVTRIEALYSVFGGKGLSIWSLYISLAAICIAYTLATTTTSNLLLFATSDFQTHSLLGTITTIIYVLSAISRPFLAKFADITSRPLAYVVSLTLYALGFVIVAASTSVEAVAAGEILYTVGSTGIDLVTDIIVADLSPLKWRGFISALPTAPTIWNAYISGYVVEGIGADGWRWGYGMFAIIMPACMAPALMVLFWADLKAKRQGMLSIADSSYKGRNQDPAKRKTYFQLASYWLSQIDAGGLIILGFAFCLFLLPFTLYKKAKGGWSNPSMIAMLVVGGVLFFVFAAYERFVAAHPISPRRIWNKTFICAVAIDTLYFASGSLRSTFFSSWTFVVKDWTLRRWTFFSNTETVVLCVMGLVAGVIQRATHRYKTLQIVGLVIRAIGMGITFWARGPHKTLFNLLVTQLLIATGGAFSVVGSRVASQASVPHQDLATVIAVLSLWTKLGGAMGAAIATAIWNDKLPLNLNKQLNGLLTTTEIQRIFASTKTARAVPYPNRTPLIQAYDDTVYVLFLPALIVSIIPLIPAIITSNFYLGDTHNTVEQKLVFKTAPAATATNTVAGGPAAADDQIITAVEEDTEMAERDRKTVEGQSQDRKV